MGRGGPRNEKDAQRLVVEDLLAALTSASGRLDCLETRIKALERSIRSRASTEYDLRNLVEVLGIKEDIGWFKDNLLKLHPNRIEKGER